MHLFHIPQCPIQNRNVHISVMNGALWDMEHIHYYIMDIHKYIMNIHTVILADLWISMIDTHNSIMDRISIIRRFMDIHNSIYGFP